MIMWRTFVLVLFLFCILDAVTAAAGQKDLVLPNKEITPENDAFAEDLLLPYPHGHHDAKRHHRYVRECQHIEHGNRTYEVYTKHSISNVTHSTIESLKYLTHKIQERKTIFEMKDRFVHGHIAVINNPLKTFSVLYPKRKLTCSEDMGDRDRASITSNFGHCVLATNAGFFNTHNGGCLGNIISDSHLVHDSKGIQNANFGIKKDGSLVTGYLPEDEVTSGDFLELVSGVGWLVRNGEIYINQSKKAECADTEETGTIERFFDVISARTAIGHDRAGRIIVAQVDGKTDKDGVNLLQFAQLLIKHGAVNAINLDGGGSSTFVVNGTVINYPSDSCGEDFSCERKVSSIICVHEPVQECKCGSSNGKCIEHCSKSKKENERNQNDEQGNHFQPGLDPIIQESATEPQYRSFAVIWFVALTAILGCSLLGNVYLINILRSRREKEKSWQKSDLKSLLEEDSDGV